MIKTWLIPLFEHMTHDATVSLKVRLQSKNFLCSNRDFSQGRQLLTSLITNDTTEETLRIAVPTLARLAVKSHIEIGETVN